MTSSHLSLNRREALAALGLMALSCRTGFSAETKQDRNIALQLYTVRDPAKKDLTGTLKRIRDMGWEYVQWSGMPNLPADKICAALEAANLKAISAHIAVEAFEKDFDGQLKFWKTVGVPYLATGSMMNDCKKTLQDWLRGAKRLDALGAKLQAAGIQFGYHNHNFEFEKYAGDKRRKIDILLESTDPKHVGAEFDIAWIYAGGADPAEYLRKYKNRAPVIHVKDMMPFKGKAQFKPLGQGAVNLKEMFAAGRESGVKWFVYEQDAGEGSPLDYVKASYEWLMKNRPWE